MPLYRLRSAIVDLPVGPIAAPFDALVTPLSAPFALASRVVSPRAPDVVLVVEAVGGVDFAGTTGYFCRSIVAPDNANWYAETDLVAA
jgi:hypothetical protein